MVRRKHNIVRSILRSFEVLLFFVISVVGFSALAKTTSLNSKTKVKSLSGSPAASCDRIFPAATLSLNDAFDRLNGFFSSGQKKSTSSYTCGSGFTAFSALLPHLRPGLLHCNPDLKKYDPSALSPLPVKDNLFQQNPVLLI